MSALFSRAMVEAATVEADVPVFPPGLVNDLMAGKVAKHFEDTEGRRWKSLAAAEDMLTVWDAEALYEAVFRTRSR